MGRLNELKKVDPLMYLVVLLLTIIIFSSGVVLGNYLTGKKLDKFTDIEQRLRLDTLGAEIQYQILIGNPCQFVNFTPITEELYELAEKLDYLESLYGEDDETVFQLKEQYSLLQVRHWLYTKETNEACGTNQIPILYFYSNEGDCKECKEQGYILTYIRKKYPQLRVYSFDKNIDNAALNTIKKIYEIEEAPTIIMNSIVYPQFMSKKELEESLNLT